MQLVYIFNEVAAFTRRNMPVIGNPAAICVVDDFPGDSAMGQAAKDLAQPMTSFVRRTADPKVFEIRHFSPDGKENHVCGHATVAAAELLARMHPELREGAEITFGLNPKFAINSDNAFRVSINGDDIALTMPVVAEMQPVDDPAFYRRLAEALRVTEEAIVRPAYYVPRIINYVVEIRNPQTLLSMRPDFTKLKDLAASAEFPHEGIMATALFGHEGHDFMTRVFLPIIDVDEDIACGSANCSVVPYWALKRPGAFPAGKSDFRGLFPYPPRMHEGLHGGVQDIRIDHEKDEVTVTGQATWKRILRRQSAYPRL